MPLDMISSGGKEAKHMTNMLIRGCTMGRTRCLVDNNKNKKDEENNRKTYLFIV